MSVSSLAAKAALAAALLLALICTSVPAACAQGPRPTPAERAPEQPPPETSGQGHADFASGGGEGPELPAPRRRRSELLLPLGSVLLPGLGQYAQGATRSGLAFTTTAAAGYTAALLLSDGPKGDEDIEGQADFLGFQLGLGTGFVSAYDSFHRSLPDLQGEGRYRFLQAHPSTERLFDAPFQLRYLKRETTLVPLAITAVLTTVLVTTRRSSEDGFRPFHVNDALFTVGVSYNAGVSEEAFFRGYLFPVLHERTGRNFWLSNSLQALAFGLGHVSDDNPVPWHATLFGFYQGILTSWNGGSVRESVFQHFWHDVIVITTSFLLEKKAEPFKLSVSLRF